MKKLYAWCSRHILLILSLFLLAFIPLYPKLPLINVQHVWVYIRAEDFAVLLTVFLWGYGIIRKRVTFSTPLTLPILLFWTAGAIATIHGILIIFPDLSNVFPNVAFLSYLRRIEYMLLFFVAFAAFREKKYYPYLIAVLTGTVLCVSLYGIGQKYFTFPAYLTMNEEFAKGIPLHLSALGRVSSTFGGQYDLAAYLVLTLPVLISLLFGYRSFFVRLILLGTSFLGLFVLFLTVSRISFLAFLLAAGLVLFWQKKKLVIVAVPVLAVIAVVLLAFVPGLGNRFSSTVKDIDVLVDAKTGDPLGQVTEMPKSYFQDKIVKQNYFLSISGAQASPSAEIIRPYRTLGPTLLLFVQPNAPTGEDLPQGTGYINLTLSPIARRVGEFYYALKTPDKETGKAAVTVINGDYLVKKALAYDLSFTTRFQGEWPNALAAFKRNIIFGSGYGSVSLAVDNSYLRMLAEVGLLGFAAFAVIFLILGLAIARSLPEVTDRPVRSLMLGFSAGTVGLALNALFIDVFEASKVAYVFWLLTGAVMAATLLYGRVKIRLLRELKKILVSPPAIILSFAVLTVVVFSPILRNYFVGDDFTWLRWAADCGNAASAASRCPLTLRTVMGYFSNASGFFYRPGMKLYFLVMFSSFWLNQTVYHAASLLLHFFNVVLIYLIARKILKHDLWAALAGLLFLLLSGFHEAVYWISAGGFLFATFGTLVSLLGFIYRQETQKARYVFLALFGFVGALTFHEAALVTPLLWMSYEWYDSGWSGLRRLAKRKWFGLLLLPVPLYLLVRYLAGSFWFGGDYSYNLVKLPLNAAGNALGYMLLTVLGPMTIPVYGVGRTLLKNSPAGAYFLTGISLAAVAAVVMRMRKSVSGETAKDLVFGASWLFIALLPFLGLGNISSRYSYLASAGTVFLLVILMRSLYRFLLPNGKAVAGCVAILAVSTFSLWQLIQLQQVTGDWYEAGETVKRFIVSMDSAYRDYWRTEPVEFHFVDVPIRHGQAWVFPVGLPDALWFIYRNPKIKVYSRQSLREAFDAVESGSTLQSVFQFSPDGSVIPVQKPRSGV
ncbi:O-antigen ligase family protein [Patescibacteria group bacterium]|nr:O-antigen ligase family protein [Patescibacteria group bacterium]